MGIQYRPGKKKDSNKIAELVDIASDGAVEYLFHDLVPDMTPVQVVAHNLENDYYPHSYKSTVVALDGQKIVGMVLSYPSALHKITKEMCDFLPANRLAHFRHFYQARVENSWYIDALCVIDSHRRNGIGSHLITLTKEKADENDYDSLSLIAFADNDSAISLYKRIGFYPVQQVELRGNEFMHHKGGCLLMKCEI